MLVLAVPVVLQATPYTVPRLVGVATAVVAVGGAQQRVPLAPYVSTLPTVAPVPDTVMLPAGPRLVRAWLGVVRWLVAERDYGDSAWLVKLVLVAELRVVRDK